MRHTRREFLRALLGAPLLGAVPTSLAGVTAGADSAPLGRESLTTGDSAQVWEFATPLGASNEPWLRFLGVGRFGENVSRQLSRRAGKPGSWSVSHGPSVHPWPSQDSRKLGLADGLVILAGCGSDPLLWEVRSETLAAQPYLLVTLVAPPGGPPPSARVPPHPHECFVPLVPHAPMLDAAVVVEHFAGLQHSWIGVDLADVAVVCRETVGELLWSESRPPKWMSAAKANLAFARQAFAEATGALLHVAFFGPSQQGSEAVSVRDMCHLASAFESSCPDAANLLVSVCPEVSETPRVRASILVTSALRAAAG